MAEDSEEPKEFYSAGRNLEKYIFEQIEGNRYLVYQKETVSLLALKPISWQDGDITYFPQKAVLWPLVSLKEDYPKEDVKREDVFKEVRKYVYENVELPHESLYDVASSWVMASYIPEMFECVPYLCFIGPKDSGKTRALEVLWQLSYRAILSPSFSTSSLFRMIDRFRPTLCLDESEIYGNEQKSEAIAVLNAGYRKGQFVVRFNTEKDDCDYFRVFGFKALASTNIFVPTIESRSIIINMRKNVREVPLFWDKEKANQLRLKLLLYRFDILRETHSISEDVAWVLNYLPIRHGRIAELFFPLIAVSPSEEIRKNLSEYAKEVYCKRLEEEKASREAEFVEILLNLKDQVKNGKLATQIVTEKFNEGKPEKQQWKPESIGRWLKRLGFNSCYISKGYRGIFYDLNLLGYLTNRYGSKEPQQPQQPQPTPLHERSNKVEDVEEVEVSRSLQDLASKTGKLERLTTNIQDKCVVCGFEGRMDWQVTLHDGSWGLLCGECGVKLSKRLGEVEG